MRKVLALITVGAGICAATSGFAADLSLPVPAKAPATTFTWTGCYVGGQVGIATETDGLASQGLGAVGANGYGAVAGGQIGCNYQTGMLVVGVEGDGLWSGVTNQSATSTGGAGATTEKTQNTWDADVAARVGAAFDRLLVYGKGGISWGRFDFLDTAPTAVVTGGGVLPGVLIGAGMEYAFVPHWTAKIEYNYVAYSQQSLSFTDSALPAFNSLSVGANEQVLKLGINYKFF
jgi:outer membrane immunogenic protein